ncbi:VOC family protein [Candidatus Cyanaurora vandensis]|uniref:VOC family protein n=1 Tax=Candidatus Cyanaurora vandensis TaxID=2714958 RepID=UPI00257A05DB|nr:VOC family protein [Candidatus Cyanaurora vandensis]
MQVLGCVHVALLVSDLAQAEHFYSIVLGLEPLPRNVKFAGLWYRVGELELHFVAVARVPSDLVEPARWGRNRHLAFKVADLAAAKAHLLAQGYPVQMSSTGRAALFTRDPDGNIIELG